MTRKTVQALVALVIALVLLLFVVDRRGNDIAADREVLLPDLREHIGNAQQIRITRSSDGENITIDREGERWLVRERDGYPADVDKLGLLVSDLADAGIVEEKTSNPANYARLGVNDPEDGGSGDLVAIDGAGFLYSVILGQSAQGEFRYARVPGEARSFLIDRNPPVPETTGDWLAPEIVDIPASRIQRVTIAHDDGETIVVEKTDESQTDFVVLDIPQGRELSYATIGNSIAGALAQLQLDDVRQRVDAPALASAQFDTWDGMTLSVELVGEGEASWLAFTAASTGEEAEHEVATINERLAGWHYRITEHKKNQLTRRWEDLLRTTD